MVDGSIKDNPTSNIHTLILLNYYTSNLLGNLDIEEISKYKLPLLFIHIYPKISSLKLLLNYLVLKLILIIVLFKSV